MFTTTWRTLTSWFRRMLRGRDLSTLPRLSFADAYRRQREPSPTELLAELKNTAWTCASINASVCASYPPRLFVSTTADQPVPKCRTRPVSAKILEMAQARFKTAVRIEEVLDHPLLELLRQVNPVHNSFDLWELTQFYLEVQGSAYWHLEIDNVLHIPAQIWVLPAHRVTPRRRDDSPSVVDGYEYAGPTGPIWLPAETVIHFRFPDPRDPYTSGLSPLRACYEQVALTSEYIALKRALYDNAGIPSVVLSPADLLAPEERDRLETQWNQKFRRGGMGRVLVSESNLKVDVLSHSLGDLAALAELKATREEICNAFHIPLPFLSGDTNLANMQAAEQLHRTVAIQPRLRRRDEKLNEQLLPWYDPSGRLFLLSDDPVPAQREFLLRQQEADLRSGVRTINEVRSERGLPPVPWGDTPRSGR